MTTKEPPSAAQSQPLPSLPFARVLDDSESEPLTLEADMQSRHGDIYTLEGSVVITSPGRVVRADRISYDAATGTITGEGHLQISSTLHLEFIQASRGTYNLTTQLGRFYDVSGSVGLQSKENKRGQYENANPFLFSGRLVVKTGPVNYEVYDGKVTSCLLPNPDWQLSSAHFSLDADKARAYDSTFRLLRVPLVFLPYVTHPIDSEQRQSGFLIPVISQSSTKGIIFGEQYYLVLGRSADLTAGFEYFTKRGYSESGTFRYRGAGDNIASLHFSALQDRGFTDPTSGLLINQGGQDVTAIFRKKFSDTTRAVGDAEYLSSYVYREAFNENFNQAVSSDITSVLYAVHQQDGYSTAVRADRYQGLKRVPILVQTSPGVFAQQAGQEVRIFHAPSVDFTAIDHPIAHTPLLWSLTSSAAGLKRTQPNFTSSGMIERLDFRPELSLPLSGGGWHTLSSFAVRETFASRSRVAPYPAGQPPLESTAPVNRASSEIKVDIRPPAIERDFQTPRFAAHLLGERLRHVIEPQLIYRDTAGINNFLSLLRFDDIDIDSNTNELEYGVTQRLFAVRRKAPVIDPCGLVIAAASEPKDETQPDDSAEIAAPSGLDANGIPTPEAAPVPQRTHAHSPLAHPCAQPEPRQQEWLSWRLAQKHFFDPTFGGAVINTRRNVFETTLNFSGIAFLTEPRDISPLISRFRMRTSSHSDIEWDFDLDTGAKRFTSSNVYIDAHEGPYFGAVSYARLNAPGRFYTETIDNNNLATLTSSAVSDFSQLRFLAGYGTPTKPGLSAAANAAIDINLGSLQYGSLQASYNWNCCGLSVEYRKYELGSVRNEGSYRFNFTLANIGTAGNLRHSERLF